MKISAGFCVWMTHSIGKTVQKLRRRIGLESK